MPRPGAKLQGPNAGNKVGFPSPHPDSQDRVRLIHRKRRLEVGISPFVFTWLAESPP